MQTASSGGEVGRVEAAFGDVIRFERDERGLTQKALATKLTDAGFPIDAPGLSRLEKGNRSIRLGEAAVIAEVLGVPLTYLTGGTDKSELKEMRYRSNQAINGAIRYLEMALEQSQAIQYKLQRNPDLLSELEIDRTAGVLEDPGEYMKWVAVRAHRIASDLEDARIVYSDKEEDDARTLARAICEGIVVRADDEPDDADA